MSFAKINEDQQLFDLSLMVKSQNYSQSAGYNDSLPPLDNVTACEDDSSVSTIGSVQATSTTPSPRRSVFSSYWQTTGQTPCITQPATPRRRSRSAMEMSSQSLTLPATPTAAMRRSIFAGNVRSSSTSSLPCVATHSLSCSFSSSEDFNESSRSVPKSSSHSQLSSSCSRPPSCLRESRFSGARKRSSGSLNSESSVRFDLDATDVRHFEKPKEIFAEAGWSTLFG